MKKILKELYEDAKNIQEKDPAAKNIWYVILLYQGFHILIFYRIGHFLYRHKLMFIARLISVYDVFSAYGSSALPVVDTEVSLSEEEEILFNQVYDAYREFSAIGLMNRTHTEKPWIESIPHDRGTIIPQSMMASYFKTQMQ